MMKARVVMAALWAVMSMACGGAPQQPEQQPEQQPTATMVSSEQELGQQCGTTVCGAGTYCCNASCNRCAPKGVLCTQEVCNTGTVAPESEEPSLGQPCGSNTCGSGTFCCNASCGICAPRGGSCTQQVCDSPL
ncbi:MAG TPA: hypothetical protein VE153_13020 [Myxococcus sp.]|jgi:hypothetical protein|nr:hypothetical protein [Myxococcus sp.]